MLEELGYKIISNAFDPTALLSASNNILEKRTQSFIYENDGSIRSLFAPHWYNKDVNNFVYDKPAIANLK